MAASRARDAWLVAGSRRAAVKGRASQKNRSDTTSVGVEEISDEILREKEALEVKPIFVLSIVFTLLFAETARAAQASVARDSWFGSDKIKHFFMSAFATSVSYSVLQAAGANRKTAMTGAVGASIGLGIARELYGRRTTGLFSYKDLTWDAIGTGAAAVMLTRTTK